MRLLLLTTLLSLILVDSRVEGIWADEDTVIIDAFEPESPSPRFKREQTKPELLSSGSEEEQRFDGDTVSVRSQRCRTPRGHLGQCTSLKECYPILFPIDPNVRLPEGTLNDGLAELLISSSGICGGGEYRTGAASLFAQVVSSEILVCCVHQSRNPPPLPPTPSPPPQEMNGTMMESDPVQSRGECGRVKVNLEEPSTARNQTAAEIERGDNKIVNGREAKRGEFPWIVALMSSQREFCGGSLIDSQTVLTAAHCVQHMKASDVQKLTIQIGDHDIYSTSDGTHEIRTASRILYHRGFSMQHLQHDVALIRLSKPIQLTNYIQLVCMHSGRPSYDNQNADVAGWGQLRDGGPQPSKLQTASVKIWAHQECKQRYKDVHPVGEGMVCAGGNGKDSCRGDSGGPLTIDSRGRAQQVGIVSWGVGCGSYPGVYTRVDKYQDWINKNRQRSFTD